MKSLEMSHETLSRFFDCIVQYVHMHTGRIQHIFQCQHLFADTVYKVSALIKYQCSLVRNVAILGKYFLFCKNN